MIAQNLIKIYENSFKNNWDLPALSEYGEKTPTFYYKDLAKEIAKLHILFDELGVVKGDKIALIGKNNILWCVTYLAVITRGAIIVPILQDFNPENVHHIVTHSESKYLFSSDSIWTTLIEDNMPGIAGAFSLSDWSSLSKKNCYSATLKQLESKFAEKYPNGFKLEHIEYINVDNSELLLINYTSGTTGFSKGVMLTANNLAGNVTYAENLNLLHRKEKLVSFLPLAHAYGCAFDFLYAMSAGVHTTLLGKVPSPQVIAQAFAEVQPHLIISVPLVLEKIYKKTILPQIEKPTVNFLLNIPFIKGAIYKKIRNKLYNALGGNFSQVIIGGAALNKEVESFLHKIKFPFTVGYGMTECAPLISYDFHTDFIPTSCGQILKDIMEVRIDSADPYNISGEIQVRGENVMMGYYKNDEASKEAFTTDGWLKTGDLGTIDKNHRIYIRGRSKTMILGANGQNIYPEEIEAKLNNMQYIMESLVVLRDRKLVALIYPDFEAAKAENIEDFDLKQIYEKYKKTLNESLSNYEQVNRFEVMENEFEKTPKKSIKRFLYE